MIRPALLGVLAALAAAAAVIAVVPRASPPAPPPAAALAAAPLAPRLLPGGLRRGVLVMVLPWYKPARPDALDRIAGAVEGAESSFGRDPLMWRSDPRLPQGPMQVSPAAAVDVGGGNRFDFAANRALGRAYLARMYARYGDWRDSVLAYNWGPGNVDRWIAAGRPVDWLSGGVSRYVDRVLYRSAGDADAPPPAAPPPAAIAAPPAGSAPPEVKEESIGDPRLRRKVAENNRMIGQLRAFLEASAAARPAGSASGDATLAWLKSAGIAPDPLAAGEASARLLLQHAGAELVFAIARDVSGRPGYANFRLANTARAVPDIDAVRLIASILVARLEKANAVLALVDAHPHQVRLRRSSAKPAKARPVDG